MQITSLPVSQSEKALPPLPLSPRAPTFCHRPSDRRPDGAPQSWVSARATFAARRPVPTPCRAPCGPPAAIADFLAEALVTLLEECAALTDEWAFLAATLLDTLLEHATVSGVLHTRATPTVLRLEHSLPQTTFQAQVLDLQALLPPICGDCSEDWLDNDLSPLLHFFGRVTRFTYRSS